MKDKAKVNLYHSSLLKTLLNYSIAIPGFVIFVFFGIFLSIIVKLTSPGPVFFIQKRIGKNGKILNLVKFRTMVMGAEKLRTKYQKMNISDGPTFKIPNDPRYTKFGKYLAKSGLDELPQLINVIKGEMSLVGPRPLPLIEAKKLTKSQKFRELVLPGITSSWIVQGAHRLKFKEWMRLDREYVKNGNFITDVVTIFKTFKIIATIGLRKALSLIKVSISN